jgi:hypothetical protein
MPTTRRGKMRWRPQCYSEASSAAFISLFFIGITSLIYRAVDGDRTRAVQLGKLDSN